MQAIDVMTTTVETVRPGTTVSEIARRLLERNISAVPVVDDENRVIGIVSEGDLMRRSESGTARPRSWWLGLFADTEGNRRDYVKSHGLHARDVMAPDVISVSEDASLSDIATVLEKHRIKRVPVVRDGKLVGIVSRADLLHGLAALGSEMAITPSDRDIKRSIERAAHDAGVSMLYVNVVVVDGVATIWGMVESEAERSALVAAAEAIMGVKRVQNNVNIMPERLRASLGI